MLGLRIGDVLVVSVFHLVTEQRGDLVAAVAAGLHSAVENADEIAEVAVGVECLVCRHLGAEGQGVVA